MAKRNVAAIGAVVLATLCGLLGLSPASAASGATQGVTATTISVGVPFVDVAAVKSVGVTINWGSVPDAFKSVINDYNSHGGVNGRKIVPYIIPVDPTSAAPAATACTQLTQDDHVFAAIGPLMPDCYLQHGVPVIAAVLTGTATGSVPDFGLAPPATAYDPLQLSIFQKHGVFKNKKVGVLAGVTTDEQELGIVQSELRKLHVNVVQTAVDSAPQGDLDAEFQQIAVITQKFQSAGVNEVVAVGYGGPVWAEGLSANQSSYAPPWIATSEADLSGSIAGINNPKYLQNVLTSTPLGNGESIWTNPGIQHCVKQVRKDYPADHINTYSATAPGSKVTWTGIEQACVDVALFVAIAKAAGKHLTVSSFIHAGYGLRNVTLPGSSTPISFAPGRPYALGPVYLVHYNTKTKTLVPDTKAAN